MRTNIKQQDKIKLNGEELEDVESFNYLGSFITGGTKKDVKSRIGKASLEYLVDFHENQAAHLHF